MDGDFVPCDRHAVPIDLAELQRIGWTDLEDNPLVNSDVPPAVVELPDDVIVAAAKAIMADHGHAEWKWDELLAGTKLVFRHHAEVALRAAYPLIAARVRAEAVGNPVRDEAVRVAQSEIMAALEDKYGHDTAWEYVSRFARVLRAEAVADERQRAVEEIRAAKGEQVRAFGSDPIPYLAGRVDGLEDAARILGVGSVPIATPGAPAPALLEPVADAIGQAMTTRQGPPEIAARAMAAAAPSIGGMCHWVQNRGTARLETHQAFHYGSPCPYEAMAAVLRSEPEPRDTAEPAGEGVHHPVAALCHSLWCEQPHVTLRRGRHDGCTISTPHWHPPPPAARPTFEQMLRDPAEQFDQRSELLPALLQHLASETSLPVGDPAASATGLPHWEHCSPALLTSGVDCGTTPRRPCACPSQGSHDHLVYPPAPGSLGYAQRLAEQRGDLADADDEDGMD